MWRWIVVSVCSFVAGAAPFAVVAAWSAKAGPGGPPDFPVESIPVGQLVAFGIDGGEFYGKVLEAPRGNWLRVESADPLRLVSSEARLSVADDRWARCPRGRPVRPGRGRSARAFA